jgi:hypothetical protein
VGGKRLVHQSCVAWVVSTTGMCGVGTVVPTFWDLLQRDEICQVQQSKKSIQ